MRSLVTGITGSIGSDLAPALREAGHEVRGFTRNAARVHVPVDDIVEGDAQSGAGLDAALDGVDVAYYLIHSMEPGADFVDTERRSAEQFARAAVKADVERIVYLGGPVPLDADEVSRHLRSRLAVEELLLEAAPSSIAFRASVVLAPRSRSFRFLVRLIERLPVLALPAWRTNRSYPIDGRDVVDFLVRAGSAPPELAGSYDAIGPELLSYGEVMRRITDLMMVGRPEIGLGFSMTPIASVVAAAVAGEDVDLIGPLMESLEHDLLPRNTDAADTFGVRLHSFDAAVEHSLRGLEAEEEVRAR